MTTLIPKLETTEVYNSRIIKRRYSSSMSSFFAISDFYFINPAFMDILLDEIYIKRACRSYITLLENIFVPACFPLDNTYKINKMLLFQLNENEFTSLDMLAAITDFKKLKKLRLEALKALLIVFSKMDNVMLKLIGKKKHAPYTAIFLNKANSIQMTT